MAIRPVPSRPPQTRTPAKPAGKKRPTRNKPRTAQKKPTARPQRNAGQKPPQRAARPGAPAQAGGAAPQAKGPAGAPPAKGDDGIFGAARKGFETVKGQVQDGLQKINQKLNPPLSPKQRQAAEYMHKMLEPNKLGGNDRTFNHQDVDAVVKGLTDKGFKGTIARRLVAGQLPKGLDEAGVKRDPNAKPDTAKREIGSDELRAFQKAGSIMQDQGKMLEKLNMKAQFPGGISQDALSHMLEGKFGLPPGIEIVPAKPW